MAEETGKLVIAAERGGSVAEISAFLADLEAAYLALYTFGLLWLPARRWPLPYAFPPLGSPQLVPLTTDALPPNARLKLERVLSIIIINPGLDSRARTALEHMLVSARRKVLRTNFSATSRVTRATKLTQAACAFYLFIRSPRT